MSDQFKPRFTNRHDINFDGIYALDLPNGTYKMVDDAFKKWEIRRGFITKEQQKMGLRGRAYHYGEFANAKKKAEEEAKKKAAQTASKKKTVQKKTVKGKTIKKKIAKTCCKKT